MAGEGRAESSSTALWGGGASLVAMGQLMFPFMSTTLFVGRDSSTVWKMPDSFPLGSGGALLRQAANRLTELWLSPGAVVITIVVVVAVVAAIAGRVPPMVPAAAGWLAAVWQVGAFLTLATAVEWARTPRPGLGLLASITGAVLLTAPLMKRPLGAVTPTTEPSGASLAGKS